MTLSLFLPPILLEPCLPYTAFYQPFEIVAISFIINEIFIFFC